MQAVTRGLVSIVVPFFNDERFLEDAVASVLAQTYDRWELILVDDGSADGSTGIARRYVERERGRMLFLQHERNGGRGPAAARNLGMAHARGEFVAFLDADDVWLPAKLERQMSGLTNVAEAGMAYGPSEWWNSWSTESQERDYVEPLGVPAGLHEPGSLLRPYFADQKAAVPNPSSMLVRRTAVENVDGFEESVPHGYEDQTLRRKDRARLPVLAADEVLDRYRQHPASLTAGRSERVEAGDRAAFLRWLTSYLTQHSAERRLIWALSRQRLRCGYRARRPMLTGGS